jgi:hypothetical protein
MQYRTVRSPARTGLASGKPPNPLRPDRYDHQDTFHRVRFRHCLRDGLPHDAPAAMPPGRDRESRRNPAGNEEDRDEIPGIPPPPTRSQDEMRGGSEEPVGTKNLNPPTTHGKNIMNKLAAIALLVAGVVLIVFGITAMDSFSSDVSRFFTGSPTDKSIWMLLGGIVAATVGLTLTLRGGKHA